jgi:GxxExxY protein
MKKITLIGTMHKEIGKCNGNELYNILEKIKPDVIFEETSRYKNMLTYTWGIDPNSPELRAIQKYIQNHNANCIPVDNLEKPKNFDELEMIFAKAIMGKNECNRELYDLFDFLKEYMSKYGIVGMNTEYFDNLNQKKHKLCKNYIKNCKIEILNKYYEADFVCYDKIIVELKALSGLVPEHESQLLNYLTATNLKVGLLINFGKQSLEYKRMIK